MNDDVPQRLERLEANAAHLEHLVEQLNEVVTEQNKTLEMLKRQLQRQAATLEAMEMDRIKATNARPPHWGK